MPGEHLVGDHAQRKDVAAGVDGHAPRLLGRDVGRCADDGARAGNLALVEQPSHAKIGEYCPAIPREQDVRRLDVAVHDAEAVGIVQGRGDLIDDAHRLGHRQRLSLAKQICQGRPVDVLHGDKVAAAGSPCLVHPDDVGMCQGKDGLGLALKAQPRFGVVAKLRWQHLKGHLVALSLVHSEVHLAHAAAPELAHDAIVPDPVDWHAFPIILRVRLSARET